MTMQELVTALGDKNGVRVVTRSNKTYDIERAVILANAREENPLIYGWPVLSRHHRNYGRVRWFLAANLRVSPID